MHIADIEMECVGKASAMKAKFNIATLLDLPINCVARFQQRVHSLSTGQAGRSS